MRQLLGIATTNRFAATACGMLVTSLIQSSSATTVMVVGFASAGLLNLYQSLGVIFGANIGTTMTAWIVSLFGFKIQISLLYFFNFRALRNLINIIFQSFISAMRC